MQFHQGFKLKKIIDKSDITIAQIIEQSGVSRGTLYNFFDYEEITRKKIKPILDVLGYDVDSFFESKNIVGEGQPEYGLKAEYEMLKKENEFLKQQVDTLKEMIELLKSEKVVYLKGKK